MSWAERIGLGVRNLVFTLIVPAAGAVYFPWWTLTRNGGSPHPVVWPAALIILAGLGLYLWCVLNFAGRGRGTPGPWDAPRQLVVVGPYRWVRNPIYIAAALVIGGEALLFLSLPLLGYLIVAALGVHIFVVVYEEPNLQRRFGGQYDVYRRSVRRWTPRRPSITRSLEPQ